MGPGFPDDSKTFRGICPSWLRALRTSHHCFAFWITCERSKSKYLKYFGFWQRNYKFKEILILSVSHSVLQLQCLLELFQILVLHFNFLYKVHNSYNTGWKICDTVAERLEGIEKICSSPFSAFGAGKSYLQHIFNLSFI